jgi:molecular chaperone DnaK
LKSSGGDLLFLGVTLSLDTDILGAIVAPVDPPELNDPYAQVATPFDCQIAIEVTIFQGGREPVGGNKPLGNFNPVGTPPWRGVPQIEITFDIDASDSAVYVTTKDKAMNGDQSIAIALSSGRSDGEIERMVSDAERHPETDNARKTLTEECWFFQIGGKRKYILGSITSSTKHGSYVYNTPLS